MSKYEMLNNLNHAALKVQTERSAQFGDDVMFCMTFPFEFRVALAHYPIVIYQSPEDHKLFPVTLFGFEQGENLFLSDKGWDAPYVPVMIQRQPFLIGFQQASNQSEPQHVVTIDMEHPRVNEIEGEGLFNEQGGYTPYLDNVVQMLKSIDEGHEQNKLLADALNKHQLTEPAKFEITLKDGSKHQLTGFSVISEERFNQLSGEALAELNQQGLLLPITMMICSISQMRNLIDRRNAALSS